MKWSRARLRLAGKLQAIERAQKAAAEMRLGDARQDSDRAAERTQGARDELDDAERCWTEHLSARQFDIELQLAFAEELLRRERDLGAKEGEQQEAQVRLDRAQTGWRQLEAGVRAGDRMLKKGQRFLSRKGEEARGRALSDLPTWEWFKR